MLIKEYRIPLPLSVEEYRVAQLYMIAKKSREETQGAGSGVEILINEPYEEGPGGSGQYTHKIYHVGHHLPGWLKALLPKSALTVEEEAWNAYPYTKTRYTCPFIEKFFIEIETKYFDDAGQQENVFNLNGSDLRCRLVDVIDIVKDQISSSDYKKEEDPKYYVSQKTNRGPLSDNWVDEHWSMIKNNSRKNNSQKNVSIMCAYKLCRVEFRYWGMQSKIEKFIHDTALRRTMVRAHRQAWTWQDEWYGLTMADIRAIEKETQELLKQKMSSNINLESNDENSSQKNSNLQSYSEIDFNVIDKDKEEQIKELSIDVKNKNRSSSTSSFKHKNSSQIEVLGDGRRKLWSRKNSKVSIQSPGEGTSSAYDQISNWRMETIVRDSETSSDEEYYDAEDTPDISPLTKWSSLECVSEIEKQHNKDHEHGDDSDNIFSSTFIHRVQAEQSRQHSAFINRGSVDTSLPNSPTASPIHQVFCPTSILIIIFHGGSVLDSSSELTSKKSDITTFRGAFESVVRQHYPTLIGRIVFRFVSCPSVCADSLTVLSNLSPYSFQSSPSAIDGVCHNHEAIPIGALPLFAISSNEYQENVSRATSSANQIYQDFLKSDEGKGFSGQIVLIGDSIGSIIAFDALCRSNHSNTSHYGSDLSLPEVIDQQSAIKSTSQKKRSSILTPRQNPLISISDGSGNEDDEGSNNKKSNTFPQNKTYQKSSSFHQSDLPSDDLNTTLYHRLLSAPSPRRRSSGSSDQSCSQKFEFEISDFFMFGSPLGLVMSFRKMLSFEDKFIINRPACGQVYNLFHPTDPSVLRIEPILSARFVHLPPINVPRYQKYPLGDGVPNLLTEYLQSYSHVFIETAQSISHTYPTMGRRTSEASVSSNVSSYNIDALSLPSINNLIQKWWGSKRIDYALYCPDGLSNFPTHALPHLFHASYWESNDVIAFILRQVYRSELPTTLGEAEKEPVTFTPSQPREKWLKKRTSVKLKNITANHRANDVIVKEGAPQIISARFMYGPLDVVALTGEKVDVHIMNDLRCGEWIKFSTEVTDKTGRVTFTIPNDKALTYGIYPVKMVVRGDHTSIDFFISVVPIKTECVVFSIDGAFTASVSVTARDPKVRAGAVDVVRHWQELGYLIIYITGRPDMQQQRVVSWLAQHNFPHGLVWFADGLSTDPLKHKAEYLKHLQQNVEMIIHAAYGSSKDIWVYQSIGLKPEQIYIVGKASKKQHAMANILSEGYAAHLNVLTSYGGSRPAQGNARMVLPRGGFGGVRQRRSAKRTTSYPLSSQSVPIPSCSANNTISTTAQSANNTPEIGHCGFFTKYSYNKTSK